VVDLKVTVDALSNWDWLVWLGGWSD
jgi:hypothetical protein